MSQSETERATIAEAIVRAWRDEAYRERLIDDAGAVLEDAGLTLPAGCRVTVLEDTGSVWHVSVPSLEDLAGGERDRFAADLAGLIPLPSGVELHLHQSTASERFLVLPLPPDQADALDDDELRAVVGGNVAAGALFGGNGGDGGNGGAGGILGGNGGNGGII